MVGLPSRSLGTVPGGAAIVRMVKALQQCGFDPVVWVINALLQRFDHPDYFSNSQRCSHGAAEQDHNRCCVSGQRPFTDIRGVLEPS